LAFDVALFTIILVEGLAPLAAGFLALVAATALTWRLNRVFTFERSGRPQSNEARRYAPVTAAAQSMSYAVFAFLSQARSALCRRRRLLSEPHVAHLFPTTATVFSRLRR
jgi:putative flippase GtrA